tara:strand:- start:30 stop:593 length:564 start_codon:yes stop_codon:yes gene_type:complete
MNIERFKSALSTGGVRPAFFRVQGNIGKTSLPDKVGFLVKAASLPASEIGEIPVDYRGRNLKLPGKRTYADWEITLLVDGEFSTRNAFERWMNDLNDAVENVADQEHNLNNVLFPNWSIDQLDRTGNPIKTYTMFHCWPKSVAAIETSYDNEALAEFSVTLAYSYFLTNDGTGSNRVPLGDAAFPGE